MDYSAAAAAVAAATGTPTAAGTPSSRPPPSPSVLLLALAALALLSSHTAAAAPATYQLQDAGDLAAALEQGQLGPQQDELLFRAVIRQLLTSSASHDSSRRYADRLSGPDTAVGAVDDFARVRRQLKMPCPPDMMALCHDGNLMGVWVRLAKNKVHSQ